MPRKYAVEVTTRASNEIRAVAQYLTDVRQSPQAATTWLQNVRHQIRELATLPYRFAVASEATDIGREIRRVGVGSFHIFYVIDEEVGVVTVVHCKHQRQQVDPENLL